MTRNEIKHNEIKHEIINIEKDSIAAELEITAGDFLISINNEVIRDVLDYRFRIHEEFLTLEVEKPDGEIWELEIEKDPDEDLGLVFKDSLMSQTMQCHNKCMFCFVDQQPKGLRPSLYIKDDDPRLSFLLGNYVTLTNLDDAEIERLAGYHLSPLRISVHAADLDLREKMMGTKGARNLFDALSVFNKAGIQMHFQVVLCKGVNDGAALDYTIKRLLEIKPGAQSLAVVPAGLTCHREGLSALAQFTQQDAVKVITQVEKWPESFVFLSDEWYVLAGKPLPKYRHYGDFPQLDNGVGMLRLFERGFMKGLMSEKNTILSFVGTAFARKLHIGIVTGKAAGKFMNNLAKRFEAKHPNIKISVLIIENKFFGETATVSGLLTGQDVIGQLKGKLENINLIILPENAFRAGVRQNVMLDGITRKQLEDALGVHVKIGSADGLKFYQQLCLTSKK